MSEKVFCVFVAGLFIPLLYQRLKYKLNRISFYNLGLRGKTGLQIHHGHWGAVFVLVSSLLLDFDISRSYAIIMNGWGWGLVLDEFIAYLKTPSPGRTVELDAYEQSLRPTCVLILVVIVLASILFFATRDVTSLAPSALPAVFCRFPCTRCAKKAAMVVRRANNHAAVTMPARHDEAGASGIDGATDGRRPSTSSIG